MCVIGTVPPGSSMLPHMCAALSTPGSVTNTPLHFGSFFMVSTAASAAQTSPPSWSGSKPTV